MSPVTIFARGKTQGIVSVLGMEESTAIAAAVSQWQTCMLDNTGDNDDMASPFSVALRQPGTDAVKS